MVILFVLSGLLAFIIGIIWLILALIFKKNKRRPLFVLLGGVLLFSSGILINNNNSSRSSISNNNTTTIDRKTINSSTSESSSDSIKRDLFLYSPSYELDENTFRVVGGTSSNQEVTIEKEDGSKQTVTADKEGRFEFNDNIPQEDTTLIFSDDYSVKQTSEIKSIDSLNKQEEQEEQEEKQKAANAKYQEESQKKTSESTIVVETSESESAEYSAMEYSLENIAKEESQKIKEITFDVDTIIINLDYVDSWDEDQFFKVYVDTSARMLEYLKHRDFENIIITKPAEFIDNKGNSNKTLAISSLYALKEAKEINYDKWLDWVFIEPADFFELSEAYYIDLRLYDGISNEYLSIDDTDPIIDNSKTIENTIYDKYGYPTF